VYAPFPGGEQDGERTPGDLEAVAVRAVQDAGAPEVGETRNLGQVVADPAREDEPPRPGE